MSDLDAATVGRITADTESVLLQNESVCTNATRDVVARGGTAGSFRRNPLDRPAVEAIIMRAVR